MTTTEPQVFETMLDDLDDAEELSFGILQMDREMVMEQFDDVYESTRERCVDKMQIRGMYRRFPIDRVEADAIVLEGGARIESAPLAGYLQLAEEVVLFAVAVHGYEELSKDPDNDMFDGMFFDAWGAGITVW